MGVSFGRARVADLTFQVFGRTFHPEWFAVRAHQRVAREGWEADVRIIEGGHAIIFRAGAIRLTEVLSGPETHLPEPGLLFHSPLRRERSTALQPGGGLDYQTCLEVERVDPEVFAHLAAELVVDDGRGRLFHQFAATNRMAPAPVSVIHVEARVKGLSVHTFHSFPDENAVVRTQSLFEPRVALSPR